MAVGTQPPNEQPSNLELVFEEARECTRCPTMHGRTRVLGEGNGPSTARCLVVAEAPGRHGASQTGIPLHGDRVGDSFNRLLGEAGIDRNQLFITNAVLCSPRDSKGQSRRPSKPEVRRCSHHLESLLSCLDPAIVVSLGAIALGSLESISPHGLTLKWDVGDVHRWHGRFLLPLYHPGSRAMIQRPWAQQKRDYTLWSSLLGSA